MTTKLKHLIATLVVGVVAMSAAGCAELAGDRSDTAPGGPVTTVTTGQVGNGGTAKPTSPPGPKPTPTTLGKLSQPDLITKVKPSVVHISGSEATGSGVVVDADRGLVLTNAHVMFGQHATRARVGDDPGSDTAVQLVATAPCDDLAVVRLVNRPANLRAIRFGNSSRVRPGDHVTVLGYPASFDENRADAGTLAQRLVATDGNVSAVEIAAAPDPELPRYASTIQHQAPTNPGNSGGPLVDDRGRLVGINTLRNPETQGQYYSISVNRVRQLLPDLLEGISQADLGWDLAPLARVDLPTVFAEDPVYGDQGGAELGRQTAGRLQQMGADGMYVRGTEDGSPVEDANIFGGNLLNEIDGQPVHSVQDVCDLVLAKPPGETLRVSGQYLDSAPDSTQILTGWETEVAVL